MPYRAASCPARSPYGVVIENLNSEPPCAKCISARGVCRSCLDHLLPKLAQPFWYRLVGTVMVEQKKRQKAEDPAIVREVERVRRRNARKVSRINRLVLGQFAPARPKRAAA